MKDFTTLKNRITEATNLIYDLGLEDTSIRDYLDSAMSSLVKEEQEARETWIRGLDEYSVFYLAILKLLAKDEKINAIKLVREHTYWSLKESRDFVDELDKAISSGKLYARSRELPI